MKPEHNDHTGTPKFWPLLAGGRCSEVLLVQAKEILLLGFFSKKVSFMLCYDDHVVFKIYATFLE
jgi:hypothetical protein